MNLPTWITRSDLTRRDWFLLLLAVTCTGITTVLYCHDKLPL